MPFNNAPQIVDRLSRTTYVVLIKVNGKTTLVMQPGLNKVWHGTGTFGKKMGDQIVAEASAEGYVAEVRTWAEAYDLLLKEYGGQGLFEKALYDRLVKKHQDKSNLIIPPSNAN